MMIKIFLVSTLLVFSLSFFSKEKRTIYLIGDSTVANQVNPDRNPSYGWGQLLPELLSSDINIENHAVNGRSTKSFISEGRWEKVLNKLKKGDFVLIQFGHNDQKVVDPKISASVYTGYRYNLEKYVKETRAKGAIPILISSIVRRNFNEFGVLVDTHGAYPMVARMVAKEMNVHFLDLQRFTEQLEISYGVEESKKLHLHFEPGENDYYPDGKHDNTHLSRLGAKSIAIIVLKELSNFKIGIEEYINKEALSGE